MVTQPEECLFLNPTTRLSPTCIPHCFYIWFPATWVCSRQGHVAKMLPALLLCLLWLWGPLQGLLAGQWGTLQQHLGAHENAFRIQGQHSISVCLIFSWAWGCSHGEKRLSLWGNRFSVPRAGAGYEGVGVWVCRLHSPGCTESNHISELSSYLWGT